MPQQIKTSRPKKEGREAYLNGRPIDDNPYSGKSRQMYLGWREGWFWGERIENLKFTIDEGIAHG